VSEWRTAAASAADTEAIGAALAAALPVTEGGPLVAYLSGDLGAGKTTLARGFLRGRGVLDPVRSPTFTLLECYPVKGLVVVHADLYRLREPSELETLGLRDLALPRHLWLIEWPERGAGHLPPPDLQIDLRVATASHPIEISSRSTLGAAWLAGTVELLRRST